MKTYDTKGVEVKEYQNVGRNRLRNIAGDVYYVPIVDGKEYFHIGETEEVAYLIGLSIKYEGLSGEFARYACRMLGIEYVRGLK